MKFRGFNSLGKLAKRENGSQKHMSDIELLKFYMELANQGVLRIGSSGFERMCKIKDRVKEREDAIRRGFDEDGKYLHGLKKNVDYRKYVNGLIDDVENSLVT